MLVFSKFRGPRLVGWVHVVTSLVWRPLALSGGPSFLVKPLVIVFTLLKRFSWFYSRILVLWRGSSILTIYICIYPVRSPLRRRFLVATWPMWWTCTVIYPPPNPFRPCACRLAVARCLGGVDRRHAPPTPSVARTVRFGYPLPKFSSGLFPAFLAVR